MRLFRAAAFTTALLVTFAAPAAAGTFPEHVRPPACDVVTALPLDIVGHLSMRPAAATAVLTELLTDACFGGP